MDHLQKFFVREAFPGIAEESFMACRANTTLQLARGNVAGQHRWNPVGDFNPSVCRFGDLGSNGRTLRDLCPEPFRGITPAALCQIVRTMLRSKLSNLFGLRM